VRDAAEVEEIIGGAVRMARLEPGDEQVVLDAAVLFDEPPRAESTTRFLTTPGHHLLVAFVDEVAVGFVSGVETVHPDKGTEMFLYELSTHEDHRRKGVARSLVDALSAIAREQGCYGMWVGTESDNEAALATYRAAGFDAPETSVTLAVTFEAEDGSE
jgi:ribosomal protein S18 acetylase RimI-like enzyme